MMGKGYALVLPIASYAEKPTKRQMIGTCTRAGKSWTKFWIQTHKHSSSLARTRHDCRSQKCLENLTTKDAGASNDTAHRECIDCKGTGFVYVSI